MNLKLAVLNIKDGQKESQIRLNTEVRLMGTRKQLRSSHLLNKYFTHSDSSPGSNSFQPERVRRVSAAAKDLKLKNLSQGHSIAILFVILLH